ncbi:uncharacterized protein [Dysidea avara]|uniref:uncharacterized protein n=1 Tax=Dysidea avara TaxID=196820 RepID=UPI00332F3262
MNCTSFSLANDAQDVFHNLSFCCKCSNDNIKDDEGSLLTLSVELARTFVALVLLVVLLLCYSTLRVLGRTIVTCTATCVLPWIVFFVLQILKSLSLIIFIGITMGSKYQHTDGTNQIGFVLVNIIQLVILMVYSLALNHEWHYRSPEYINPQTAQRNNSLRHLLWRPATIFIGQALITLALLVAVEIIFISKTNGPPIWLVYLWLIAMLIQRATVCVLGVLVCFQHSNVPSNIAKVLLILGLLFSIGDDLPNSLLSTGKFCTHEDTDESCYLNGITLYDIFQTLGILGLTFLFLFVRDQYKRVEEECKHHLLWDLERLLDVNAQPRHDLLTK